MTKRDRGIVAALGVVLVALSIAVALPRGSIGSLVPVGSTEPGASPSAGASAPVSAIYREGTIGRPSSINPLTARTQADRDLVALVFSGLVALGPDGTYRPDLASGWSVDAKGKTWTFTIRPEARWQDGEPVTSDDVVFTVNVLKSPGYTGALAASWREVSVTALDARTVVFELTTPIGGFLQAATIGLLPAHLLSETPIETLADDPFSVQPVGAGPFVLTSWNAETATLIPAIAVDLPATDPGASPPPSEAPVPSELPAPSESASPSEAPAEASGAPSAELPSVSPAASAAPWSVGGTGSLRRAGSVRRGRGVSLGPAVDSGLGGSRGVGDTRGDGPPSRSPVQSRRCPASPCTSTRTPRPWPRPIGPATSTLPPACHPISPTSWVPSRATAC